MGKLREQRSNIPVRGSNLKRSGKARGSLHTISNGRVSTNHYKETFNKFDSRVDARMKLLSQKVAKPRDARDILEKKFRETSSRVRKSSREDRQERASFREERDSGGDRSTARGGSSYRGTDRGRRSSLNTRSKEKNRKDETNSRERLPESKNDPIVIVTGLGKLGRDRDGKLNNRDHYVTNRGNNTFITLNNDKYNENKDKRSHSRERTDKTTSSSKNPINYEPIKIKITNSNYVPKMNEDSPMNESENNSQLFNANSFNYKSNTNLSDVNNRSEESMDFDSSDNDSGPVTATKFPLPNNTSDPFNCIYTRLAPPGASFQTNLQHSLSTLNSFNANFRPPGLIVNNFPTGGMYSQIYDNIWNKNNTNFYDSPQIKPNLVAGSIASNNSLVTKPQSQVTAVPAKDGYKLLVSNLHPKVTEDDVLELFSDIGPIKRARFIDKGLAEVIYVRIEHAKEAIEKYDLKELDGRQMVIGFADKSHMSSEATKKYIEPKPMMSTINGMRTQSPLGSTINTSYFTSGSINPALLNNTETLTINTSNNLNKQNNDSDLYYKGAINNKLSDRFKCVSSNSRTQIPESKHHDKHQSINHVENSIIQQVLFNKKPLGGTPVTFTVKL